MTGKTNPIAVSTNVPIVSVVDGDATIRKTLELLIHPVGWQVRCFSSAWDFLACPRVQSPNCLILDAAIADLNCLELQKRIADRHEMPIIFITNHSDVSTTVQAMKAGAFEFMTKPFRDEVMLSVISAAVEHSRTTVIREMNLRVLRERYALLSYRERQVMSLVVRGLLNKLIGVELGISEITVKAHRGKVMRKMNAHSLPELVTTAAQLPLPAVLTAPKNDSRIERTPHLHSKSASRVNVPTEATPLC